MTDKTWKSVNRKICRMLGGRRAGYDGDGGADCAGTEPFSVEVKHKMALPDWLKGALLQAETYAGRNELPIAVLHEAFSDTGQSIVLVRLSDFVEWYVSQKEGIPGWGRWLIDAAASWEADLAELARLKADTDALLVFKNEVERSQEEEDGAVAYHIIREALSTLTQPEKEQP